ncbi:MAG: lysophospholipid acyltransferase family protein [Myxococcota bacterium]
MDLTLEAVACLDSQQLRVLLPQWLTGFLEVSEELKQRSSTAVEAALERFDDAQLQVSLKRLLSVGNEYRLYRADPLATALTRAFMDVLSEGSALTGLERLKLARTEGPVLLISNHLAYCDTQLKDTLFANAGADDVASSMIVVAGPKVYETAFRRMASLGLSTLKTAQSAVLSHNDAELSAREVASIAVETVHVAHEQMKAGGLVLLYGEGSRSRTRQLQPFIKAIRKYASLPGCQVVPMAISGSQEMMPLNQTQMYATPVTLQIGKPVVVDDVGRSEAIALAWEQIANMLPEVHRPEPSTPPVI